MSDKMFDDVPVHSGTELMAKDNTKPAHTQAPAPMVAADSSLAAVESAARAIAEVKAKMEIAKTFPRNVDEAREKIMLECTRPGMADKSTFAFKRGGNIIEGPTIRLANMIGRLFGNLDYGFQEHRVPGGSEVRAHCVDLETNTWAQRTFFQKHWRDTQSGGYKLKSERDKYELIANMAQRRVRACIFEIVPGDIIEDALDQCRATMERTLSAAKVVKAFERFDVTVEMIESWLQHSIDGIRPSQVATLRNMFRSLKDGVATVDEFFLKPAETKKAKPAKSPKEPAKDKPKTAPKAKPKETPPGKEDPAKTAKKPPTKEKPPEDPEAQRDAAAGDEPPPVGPDDVPPQTGAHSAEPKEPADAPPPPPEADDTVDMTDEPPKDLGEAKDGELFEGQSKSIQDAIERIVDSLPKPVRTNQHFVDQFYEYVAEKPALVLSTLQAHQAELKLVKNVKPFLSHLRTAFEYADNGMNPDGTEK